MEVMKFFSEEKYKKLIFITLIREIKSVIKSQLGVTL